MFQLGGLGTLVTLQLGSRGTLVTLQPGSLEALVASTPAKAFVTLVTLVVVVATWRLVDSLHDHEANVVPQTWRHFGLSAVSVLVTTGGGLLVIGVWGLTEPLFTAFEAYQFGPGTVVNVVLGVIILAVAYGATDLVARVTRELTENRRAISEHQREILYRLSQVSLYVVAGSIVLGLWGVNLGGLLVGAGFLGIVLGMAARQTLGSLIAGFVLMFARPFEIGDWVAIGDEEGFVTDITIMNTHMRTFDGEYVVVPNDLVTNQAITNRSREGRLRIHMEVGIGYDDDPEEASEIAEAVLEDIDTIANNPKPYVIPSGFGDSAILLDLRFWIDPPTPQARWRSKATAVELIQDRFADAGITIPYPQRTVSYPPETTDETVERVENFDGDGRASDRPA